LSINKNMHLQNTKILFNPNFLLTAQIAFLFGKFFKDTLFNEWRNTENCNLIVTQKFNSFNMFKVTKKMLDYWKMRLTFNMSPQPCLFRIFLKVCILMFGIINRVSYPAHAQKRGMLSTNFINNHWFKGKLPVVNVEDSRSHL